MSHRTLSSTAIVMALATHAWGQGFVISPSEPPARSSLTIPNQRIDIDVQDQVTRVQVNQTFRNPTARTIEVEYFFPLPTDATIDSFVLMVDGKEIPGTLMGHDEARKIYEDIVRRRKDPALLEYVGHGLFKASVFPVPAGAERQLNLTYSQISPRDSDIVTVTYPLGTAKHFVGPIQHLEIDCRMTASDAIRSAYSPTHDITVARPDDRTAQTRYEGFNVMPQDDFKIMFGMSGGDVGFLMMSYRPTTAEPGYFLLLASPKIDESPDKVLPKTVVFVLDKSGSMTGTKIEQAKKSLRFVLRNLNPDDMFNVIVYDTEVRAFQRDLQPCSPASIDGAMAFVDQIDAGGGTNIDGALRSAMDMMSAPQRPAYVLFLTDGLPTSGNTNEAQIVANCTGANNVRARVMAFGVGDDVNARLLDRLVARNYGTSHYVRPNQDIEEPVSKLYTKLSAPVLSHLELNFAGLDEFKTYPRHLPDLFRGGQLLAVGRYHRPGETKVTLRGRALGATRVYHRTVKLDDHAAPYKYAFIEKLWAQRRIGYLIDEIDLNGRNPELVEEIVRLSTRHGILTPYTAFLADERVDLDAVSTNSSRAGDMLDELNSLSGARAIRQRVGKGELKLQELYVGGAPMVSDMAGHKRRVYTVQSIGDKVFYFKNERWLDSTVTAEMEKTARVIEQYSPEYFELVRTRASIGRYLTFDDGVTLELDGQVYRIVQKK